MDVGLDNGDGGGTARDGTLQAGEIDDTAFLCTPPPQPGNASFESGFTDWITQDLTNPLTALQVSAAGASDGSVGVVTGFDGDGGPGNDSIFVAQDIDLTGIPSVAVSFDWAVVSCDLQNFGATLPRVFSLLVEPFGGGAPLLTQDIFTCPVGVVSSQSLVNDQVVDISSVADQPVRIKFRWFVPEDFVGPAEAYLDDVKLLGVP